VSPVVVVVAMAEGRSRGKVVAAVGSLCVVGLESKVVAVTVFALVGGEGRPWSKGRLAAAADGCL